MNIKKFSYKSVNSTNDVAINIIKKYDCIADTIDRARHFANVAVDSLGSFKDNKYKTVLINLIHSSLDRLN